MPRPRFSLRTLLWLVALVAAFFGGAEWGKRRQATNEAVLRLNVERLDRYLSESVADNSRLQQALPEHDIDLPDGVRPIH